MECYDKIIIGAGIYGLYAAGFCGRRGQRVLVLEREPAPFGRATYINQARVHHGYHYPRSLSTAMRSAGYFDRFNKDYSFCINSSYTSVYALSKNFSWCDGSQFSNFCRAAGIPCEEVSTSRFFNDDMCDRAFITKEYTYDAKILCDHMMSSVSELKDVQLIFNAAVTAIDRSAGSYEIGLSDGRKFSAPFILNASYASVNQILDLAGFDKFRIKYELCEIILCEAGDKLSGYGFTVMDGPFFSIMPFGMTGLHSLTSVSFTPHATCRNELPSFSCQERSSGYCSPSSLGNCNSCPVRPSSASVFMEQLAHKYLKDEYSFKPCRSLYSMKPILMSSEIDDSRPTVIRRASEDPAFVSVLSGKINTIYDLDEVLI